MGADAGTAYVGIEPDLTGFDKKLTAALAPATRRFSKLGLAAGIGLGAITTGAVAAGAALYEVGEQFDDAEDRIRVKTGRTGKHLARLTQDFKNVVSSVPTDFENASTAIAGLNQRLGLSGRPLRRLSKDILELSRITETDLGTNIQSLTRLFGDWGVKTAQQPKTLNKLFRASQATGIEISRLSDYMVQFGSPLRQMGFDFDTAAAMFSKFEKEGVNLQTAMPGLRMALKNFASEGKDPAQALAATIDKIRSAASTAKANTMAFEIFGTRAGPDLAAAIREGRFNFDSLIHTIARGKDTIRAAGQDTMDFAEHWMVFKNRMMVAVEPLASRVFAELGDAMERVGDILTDPKLSSEEKFSQIFDMVADAGSKALSEMASQAGQFAPKVAESFARGFVNANVWGKLVIGGFLLAKLGGRGGIMAAGATAGKWFGTGMAASTTAGAGVAGLSGLAAGAGGAGAARWLGTEGSRAAFFRSQNLTMPTTIAASLEAQGGVFRRTGRKWGRSLSAGMRTGLMIGVPFIAAEIANAIEGEGPLPDEIREAGRKSAAAITASVQGLASKGQLSDERFKAATRALAQLRVETGMSTAEFKRFSGQLARAFNLRNLKLLRSGMLTTFPDIQRVAQRSLGIINSSFRRGSAGWRRETSVSMRATALAIAQQMNRSGNVTEAGWRRIRNLFRNANLLAPTRKQAADFGREWAKGMDHSREITRKGIQRMLHEAKQMPGPLRRVALQAWFNWTSEAKRSGNITAGEFRKLRSRALSEFSGLRLGSRNMSRDVVANVMRMATQSLRGVNLLESGLNAALGTMGVQKLNFSVKGGRAQRKQRGGPINIGAPSGDSVPALLERGEYVLNRNAVRAVGKDKLDAVNFGSAKRFQVGGYAGVSGDTDFVAALGFALSKMARATGTHINVASGRRSMAEQAALYAAYLAGTGNLAAKPDANAPHVRGIAADIAPGRETFGSTAGKFGMGFTVPSESWHIELLNAALGAMGGGAALAPKLARVLLEGADGPLKDLGQGALDKVHSAAQRYIDSHASFGGFGGAGGPWKQVMQQIAQSRGWDFGAWWELVMRESGGDPEAVNPSSGAFGLGQFLGGTAQAYARYGAFSHNPSMQIKAMAKYIADRYGSPTAALAFHDAHNWYREGGLVGLQSGGGPEGGGRKRELTEAQRKQREGRARKGQREGQLAKFRQAVAAAQSDPAKQTALWRLMHFWGRVGEFDRGERQHFLSAIWNAASQVDERGTVNVLSSLAGWARSHGEISGHDPDRHKDLTDQIERAIERGRRRRQAKIERRNKQIARRRQKIKNRITGRGEMSDWVARIVGARDSYERAQEYANQLTTLEPENITDAYIGMERGAFGGVLGREKDWRNTLVLARDAANNVIASMQAQIENILGLKPRFEQGTPIGGRGKRGQRKLLGGFIQMLARGGGPRLGRGRVAPKNEPGQGLTFADLRYKLEPLRAAISNVRTLRDDTWLSDLKEVQGLSGPLSGIIDSLPSFPTPGSFGGLIFDTQAAIQELGLRGVGSQGDDSEALELQKELTRQANLRAAIADAALPVLKDWDALFARVRGPFMQQGGEALPFGGVFHTGGVTPGPPTQESIVKVRGAETIFNKDQTEALGGLIRGGDGGSVLDAPQAPQVQIIVERGAGVDPRKIRQEIIGAPIGGRLTPGGMER